MVDESEDDLRYALKAVRSLRASYHMGPGSMTASDDALRELKGHLDSDRVTTLVDPLIKNLSKPIDISSDRRKCLLNREAELAEHVGEGSDRRALKRALRAPVEAEPSTWCRSAKDLADYVTNSHALLRSSVVPAPVWNLRKKRHNTALMKRADRAALAVGILLVDILDRSCLRVSYQIGTQLAQENGEVRS